MHCYDWSTSFMCCIITILVCWSRLLLSVFLMAGWQLQLFAFKFTNQLAMTLQFSAERDRMEMDVEFRPPYTFCNRVIKVFIWLHPLQRGSISLIRGSHSTLLNSSHKWVTRANFVPLNCPCLTPKPLFRAQFVLGGKWNIEAKVMPFRCIIYLP